jgi:hypothetical protein
VNRRRCWCGRGVPRRWIPYGVIECGEHAERDSAPCPITDLSSTRGAGTPSPAAETPGGAPWGTQGPARSDLAAGCRDCDGDGFLFHVFEGAVELIGPCPNPMHQLTGEDRAA